MKATDEEKVVFLNDEDFDFEIENIKRNPLDWMESGSPMCIYFVFPSIIFEGKLYSAKFPLDEENLFDTKYVHFWGEHKSTNYLKAAASIDVVSKEFLPGYLKMIAHDIDLISRQWQSNGSKMVESISQGIVKKLKPDLG
jgi:hypothetical protein